MARQYGTIQSGFWRHPSIRPLGGDAKILAAYLLTSPHTTGIGCFFMPAAYASADLNISLPRTSKSLQELESTGFLRYCAATEHVLILKFMAHNRVVGPKSWIGRLRELKAVPTAFEHLPALLDECRAYCPPVPDTWAATWAKHERAATAEDAPSIPHRRATDTPSKDHRSPEQEQEQEQGEDKNSPEAPEKIAISLPVIGSDGAQADIDGACVTEWQAAYPGIDAMQELRHMRQWLIANPTRRKTARGLSRFVVNWLGRAQDRAKPTARGAESATDRGRRLARGE